MKNDRKTDTIDRRLFEPVTLQQIANAWRVKGFPVVYAPLVLPPSFYPVNRRGSQR